VGATLGPDARPATFSDARLEDQYATEGYLRMPLLDPDRVARLRCDLERLLGNSDTPFMGALDGDTVAFRQASGALVREHVEEAAAEVLPGQSFFMTAFFSKAPRESSQKTVHQDWTVVDEHRFVSGLVWVPLQDTDEHNGGLQVAPGSHRLETGVRGTPDLHVPVVGTHLGERLERDLLVAVDLQAGEAAITNHRIFHGSPPNRSTAHRLAVGLAFHPTGSPLYHWFDDGGEGLLRFEVEPGFFLTHVPPARPDGRFVIDVVRVDEPRPAEVPASALDAIWPTGGPSVTSAEDARTEPDTDPNPVPTGGRGRRRRWRRG
jgi:hypothetical protein